MTDLVMAQALDGEDLGWQERALCAQTDPEAFFPEKGGSTREAKKVCRSCEVRAECLEYALEHDERFGIWGGCRSVNAAGSSVRRAERPVSADPGRRVSPSGERVRFDAGFPRM